IYINQLSFSHDPSLQHHALHNLELNIKRGYKIALIGQSGSGKSTLLSLLRGLYLPGKYAALKIDEIDFPFDTIQDKVTLFPQEPEIFENSIAYNVTMGLPCSEAEINRVCDIADFSEVIKQMPHGLSTDIREKGVNLSGGQKQRL